jgi:hypothetical protein
MLDSAAILSIISNGVFVGTTAYFVKRWMDKTDAASAKTAADLQEAVKAHQRESQAIRCQFEEGLDKIYDQLRIANGRTSKIEGELMKVEAVCAERHGNGK